MKSVAYLFVISICLFSCGENNDGKTNKDPKGSSQKAPEEIYDPNSLPQPKDSAAPKALTINTQPIEGDQGQITFSQNDKTIFYYDLKSKKGKVMLNGTTYLINRFDFDAKNNSYRLSGDELNITAPDCKYKKQNGEDCSYGTIAQVTVTQGTNSLVLHDVAVQDCPNY